MLLSYSWVGLRGADGRQVFLGFGVMLACFDAVLVTAGHVTFLIVSVGGFVVRFLGFVVSRRRRCMRLLVNSLGRGFLGPSASGGRLSRGVRPANVLGHGRHAVVLVDPRLWQL